MTKPLNDTPKWVQGCFVLVGLGGLFFGVPLVAQGVREGSVGVAILGGLCMLFTVPLPIFFLLSMWARSRIGKPQIALSRDTLRVGESFVLEYTHRFPRSVHIRRVVVELILRERVSFRAHHHTRGGVSHHTRTLTHDHIVQEIEKPGGHFQAGETLHHRFALRIPPNAMHSFAVHHNHLLWRVRVRLDIPHQPDLFLTFPLQVLPKLVFGGNA